MAASSLSGVSESVVVEATEVADMAVVVVVDMVVLVVDMAVVVAVAIFMDCLVLDQVVMEYIEVSLLMKITAMTQTRGTLQMKII